MNQIERMTMTQAKHWQMNGMRHDQLLPMLFVPNVIAAAGMEPPNQPQL